jgi:hypothetical protein
MVKTDLAHRALRQIGEACMSVRRSMLASVAGEKPGRPQFVGIAEILPSEGRGQDSAFQFAPPPVECHRIPRARHTTFAAPGLNRRQRFSWMVCRRVLLAKTNDSAQDPTSASAHNRYTSRRNYFAEDDDGWWIASLERPEPARSRLNQVVYTV